MMETQFSLRPATTEDIPEVLKIEKEVYPSPWTEGDLRSELVKPYSHFLVLTDDETDSILAGYMICWMLYDEAQILSLAVDPQYRRLGLAKYMVRKIFSIATRRGVKKVVLEVRKSNLPAIYLYQGLNFSITHIGKGHYKNGEDAYHMTAYLDEEIPSFPD